MCRLYIAQALALCLGLAGSTALLAQQTITLDDVVQSAQQWANENLDEDFLSALGEADQRKIRALLQKLQQDLQGEYVIDLAQLKAGARAAVPLLEQYEETLPYAEWLKTRLDYFDIADQLRVLVPPPKSKPGEPSRKIKVPPTRVRELWVRKFSDRPVPEDAKPWVGRLKKIFAAEKIPPELVWVAEVESSFDPRARSPAGATGLFQLMPVTARQYGLSTWPLDQRLKPEANARAAAQHLKRLQAHYHDWRLALAAYNAGEGTVEALLAKQKTASFDAIAPRLPAETQLYVPKVEAVIKRREGVSLKDLLPHKAR